MFPRYVRTLDNPQGEFIEKDRQRLTFYHIQKTAGSTFRYMLQDYFRPEEICQSEIFWEIEREKPESLEHFKLFGGHFRMETFREHLNNTYKIIFLRDPINRFLSEFSMDSNSNRRSAHWVARAQEEGQRDPTILEYLDTVIDMDLDDYLEWDNVRARNKYRNHQTRRLAMVTDKTRAMPDWDEDILNEAKKNLSEMFCFCGLTEHFDLSIKVFCMTFGVLPYSSTKSYMQNVNPKKSFDRKYAISPSALEKLQQHNRMDFELYDFGKELLFKRLVSFQQEVVKPKSVPEAVRKGTSWKKKDYSIEELGSIRGVHALEKDGLGRSFRWTGSESEVVVDVTLPSPARKLKVTIEALTAINQDCIDGLTFSLAGQSAESIKQKKALISKNLTWKGEVDLGGDCENHKVLLLRIQVPRVSIETDERLLGIALSKIRVEAR